MRAKSERGFLEAWHRIAQLAHLWTFMIDVIISPPSFDRL